MHARMTLWALALLCVCSAPALSQAGLIPLYPGSARQPFPDTPAGRANAMCTCDAAASKVGAWYKSELAKLGWTIVSSGERPGREGSAYSLMATHPEGKRRVTIMVTPVGKKSRDMIGLTGDGVTAQSIGGEAKPFTIPKPETKPGTKPGATVTGPTGTQPPSVPDLPTDRMPPASGVWGEIGSPFEAMLAALERFCDQPTVANARAASDSVSRYMTAADKLKAHAGKGIEAGNAFAGFSVFGGSMVDFDVSMIGGLLDEAVKTPAKLPEFARKLKPIVERLRNKVRRAIEAPAQYASNVEALRADPLGDVPAVEPTKEHYRALGLEPPPPSTEITVSCVWTPSRAFWAVQLKDTMVAQRCWNAGCPDECVGPKVVNDVEVDGECAAFGVWKHRARVSGLPYCLQLTRTPEREKELLSRKMTCFGLVALNVEVGDPDQLKAGGEIKVWLNGDFLGSVPLPAAGKPARNANPWDYGEAWARKGRGTGATFSLGAEKQYRGIKAVYGDEAAEAYKTAARFESAISAATGGEIDGYSRFVHVGVGAADAKSDSLLLGLGGGDMIGLSDKIRKIAEKAHPALEAIHRIRVQAIVGGVPSESVEFEVAGPFKKIADAAGTFSGWPGGPPASWSFGSIPGGPTQPGPTAPGGQLGPPPLPDTPPLMSVSDDRTMLLKANRRFATMCATAVLKPWYESLRDLAAGKVLEMFTPAVPTDARQAIETCFKGDNGALNLTKAYKSLGTIMSNLAPASAEWMLDSLESDLANNVGKAIDKGIGDLYFKNADEFVTSISVYGAPSYQVLTYDAQARISALRREMWGMARYAQEEAEVWGELADFADNVVSLGGWLKGNTFTNAWTLPVEVFKGTGWAGVVISHLNQLRMIAQNYQEIARILEDDRSWRKASVEGAPPTSSGPPPGGEPPTRPY